MDAITAALPVDVALIDAQFPSQTSVEVIKRLRNVGLDTRVVIISVNPSVDEVKRVFQSGAHGFLLREAGVDELEVALHAAAKGEMFLCPTILKRLFGRPDVGTLSHRTSASANAPQTLDALHDMLEKALRLGILESER